jgi:hypothetical protein
MDLRGYEVMQLEQSPLLALGSAATTLRAPRAMFGGLAGGDATGVDPGEARGQSNRGGAWLMAGLG